MNIPTKIIEISKSIDSLRIFPRIFISVYMILLYDSIQWFMSLNAPTPEQTTLISVITGIGAAWFGLYIGSGNKK
jgi:hypothetical protein